MTLRQELRPWDSPPQETTQIANGLRPVGVWLASIGSNLVTGSPVSRTQIAASSIGRAWQLSGAGITIPLLVGSVGLPTQTATVVLKAYRVTAGKRVDWGVADSADATKRCGGHIPFTDGTVYFDFGGATSGSTRLSVAGLTFSPNDTWAFSVGARGMEIWQNGRLVASNSGTPTRSSSADNWGLGTHGNTTSSADESSQWAAAALFGSQLPASLIAALTSDFYGTLFEPQVMPRPYTAAAGGGNTIAVPAGSLVLTGFAPTVSATANQRISVPAGSLTLTANAPTVTASDHKRVAVPAGSLSLTGFAPTVTVTAGNTINVPAGALSLTAFAPVVTATANQRISVPAGALTLTAFAPTVSSNANQTVNVPAGVLSLTGFAPTVTATANQRISVPAGALTLTGYAPTVSNGVVQARPQGGGRSSKPRKRVVEVNGQDIVVSSTEEAQALIDRLKDEAKAKAALAIQRATSAQKRKPRKVIADARRLLEVPEITAPDELQTYAARAVSEIEDLYRSTLMTVEISAMLSRQQLLEEDDEEVLLLLV